MKRNSPNTSGTVTDQPEQALSCAAREVIMRKCAALFPLCVLCASALILSGCMAGSKKGRTTRERFDYAIVQPVGGKPFSVLTCHEIWRDEWTGGVRAFLADPKASGLVSLHTNQDALGGSSSLTIGNIESNVNTNAVKTIADSVSQTVSDVVSKIIVPKP